MTPDLPYEPPSAPRKKPQVSRARSLPYRRPYVFASVLFAIFILGLIAIITSIILFVIKPNALASKVLLLSILIAGTAWFVGYFKRAGAFCPLCKGTPLLQSGATVHANAVRIPPLNYGASAILCIIATQQFRCMHCGTRYDLLKPTARERNKEPEH